MDNKDFKDEKPEAGEFALYLKSMRKKQGLNQQQLAQMIEITSGYYGFFEQGRAIPSQKIIRRLARALKLDYNELLKLAGYPPEDKNGEEDTHSVDETGDAVGDVEAAEDEEQPAESAGRGQNAQQRASDTVAHQQNTGEAVNGVSQERINWAIRCIDDDPDYQLGEQYKNIQLPEALLIRLYQAETRRQLLTPEESAALA